MADGVIKTLYLTENIEKSDGSGDIQVPPPMLLVRIPHDFTGQVILNYNEGGLRVVERAWKERYKPIELTDKGFRGAPQ